MSVKKVVILGSNGCGKTSLLKQLYGEEFSENESSTIGVDFHSKHFNGDQYQLWDTAGDSKFELLIPSYCKNANIIIVAFDLTNSKSFDDAKEQIKKLYASKETSIVLLGTKSDLKEEIQVTEKDIKNFTQENNENEYNYIETSAIGLDVENFMNRLNQINQINQINQREQEVNVKKNAELDKPINDLINLCNEYMKHLNEQKTKATGEQVTEQINTKLTIVTDLKKIFTENSYLDKKNQEKLESFKEVFEKNKTILCEHRDKACSRFMAGVARVLSIVGLFIPRMGSLAFWKSHGEIFSDKAKDITSEAEASTSKFKPS